jgi:hypothetical protein
MEERRKLLLPSGEKAGMRGYNTYTKVSKFKGVFIGEPGRMVVWDGSQNNPYLQEFLKLVI